jgi:hypothetical protein
MGRPDFSNHEAPETAGERVLRPLKLAWGAIEIFGWLAIIIYPAYLAGLWPFQSAASGSWTVFLGVAAVALGALVWLAVSAYHTRLVLSFGVFPIASAVLAPLISRWLQ